MDTLSSPEREPPCPRCGGAGFLRYDLPADHPLFGDLVRCHCKEREIQERRLRSLMARSNLAALSNMTFETFIVDAPQRTAFSRAQQFAANPEGWLVIMGSYGVGKTHLAAAIGNYRLSAGQPVLFQVVPDLLDHLRSAYAPGSEAGYDELFESIRQVSLLILDDLGTQISTQWAQEKLFQLLNHRHNFKLPTVITTNNSLDEIGGRLASRMSDPQLSYCVTIDAGDFRSGADNRAPADRSGSGGRPQRRRTGRSGIEFTDRL
ncbi:MAG TPA: ATP-binding protein [Chloroflexota bacterium]|jgi:DNA replication protein DnaC|nr:ATP-binding protein [Chloroflexota bacterium]